MLQVHKHDLRNRLRSSASALMVAAVVFGLTAPANADTITLDSSTSPVTIDGGTGDTVVVPSGTNALLTLNASYYTIPTGYDNILYWTSTGNFSSSGYCSYNGDSSSCLTYADTIEVEEGATLYVDNPWWWQVYESMFDVEGDVTFAHGGTYLTGSNSFTGDITLESSATVSFGVSWAYATTTFGEDTDFIMGSGTELDFYEPNTVSNTVNTFSSTDSSASVNFYNGTMIVNGANTTDSAFYGSVTLNAGATLMIGDSDHSDAVFGDPTGYTTTITVNQAGGVLSTLAGYGTIDGSVVNYGIVEPGGESDTAGTLIINGDYTQSSTAQLAIDVTSSGASELVVNGTATLDGTLVLNIEDGNYSNAIYTIVEADTLTGSLSLSDVTSTSAIVGVIEGDNSYQLVVEKASSAQTFGHMMSANRSYVESFNRALYDEMEFNSAAAGEKIVPEGGYRVWLQPFGRLDNVGRGGVGYENRSVGFIGGAEYRQPAWHNAIIGAAISYGRSNMDIAGENSSTGTDTVNFAAYGGVELLNARVDGTVFYNFFDGTAKRHMGSDYGTAKFAPSGWSYGFTFQVSRSIFDDLVTPYVRGMFARNHTDDATESGSDYFSLKYNAVDKDTFVGDMGFRFHILKPTSEHKIKLEATIAVQHDFSGTMEITEGSFANIDGSTFTYSWDGNSDNALLAGVEIGGEVYKGFQLFGRLNGQFTTNQRSGEISIGGRYRF